ncbi:tape measure protein [Pectobacterium brasiliense]|uniref:tape measure protein n=1 Tax=Pectobacterium brasiliense TaxID=180957 RepID=UPI0032EEC237
MATLRELIIKISANSQSFQSEISRASRMGGDYYKIMQNGGRQAAAAARESQRAFAELNSQFVGMKSAAAGIIGAISVTSLITMADNWGQVTSRMKMATESSDELALVQRRLMEISDRTYKPIEEQAELFIRSSNAMKELGYSTAGTIDFIDSISSALTINAASADKGQSAINALSKSMVQGKVSGDEWNTVMEVMPTVVGDIARAVGTTETAVKKLAADGKLSMQQFADAVIAAQQKNAELAENMPTTVGDAITKLSNHMKAYAGETNSAYGTTQMLSGGISTLADNIDTVATVGAALVGIGFAKYFGGMTSGAYSATAGLISAAKSEVALAEAQLRGTQVAIARARSAVYRAQQALVAAQGTDRQAAAEKRLTATQTAVTRNIAARTAAQANLNNVTAVGSRLMSGALGLVGGVPGLLMLGAGAWYYMYQKQEQARESAIQYAGTLDDVVAKSKEMNMAQLGGAIADSGDSIKAQEKRIDELRGALIDAQSEYKKYNDLVIMFGVQQDTSNGYTIKAAEAQRNVDKAIRDLDSAQKLLSNTISNQNKLQDEAINKTVEMSGAVSSLSDMYERLNRVTRQTTIFSHPQYSGPVLPALDDKQQAAITKQQRDRILSSLKDIDRARKQAEFEADDLNLPSGWRQKYISDAESTFRSNEANKPQKKGPKTDEEKAIDNYERLIKQQREQLALGSQNTELAKIKYQTSQGELSTLTDIQKQELARNAALIDQREIYEKLKSFKDSLSENNASAREKNNVDFIGMGEGERVRERMRELISIQSEFAKQQRELQRDFQNGSISGDLYKKETEALQEALNERLEIQSEYYKSSDEQRADWLGGVTDRLATFADEAKNYSQMAADATSSILDGATSSIANGLEGIINGSMSASEALKNAFAGMGKAVIQTLTDMAAQWLVYQAVQLVVEKTTQGAKTPAMVSNAQATALQAQLAAFASTAAIPIIGPAAAPAAMAAAAAVTTPLVAAISASALAGMAHDGIDRVPETGTWLLQKGERVVTAQTSAKLDSTLAMVQKQRQEERESAAAGFIYSPTIQVNGDPDDRTMVMMQNAVRQGAMQGYQMVVNHLASGQGQVSKALGSGWGTSRRKR